MKNTSSAVPASSAELSMLAVFSNATFVYDGDGVRVKSVLNTGSTTTTTYFIGNYFEKTGDGVVTKYYYAGAQRIAMRKNGVLNYILGDHLGSTSIVTDAAGNVVSQTQYKAWGETRYSSGNEVTKYQYTGQYSNVSDFGLMFYNARWYDPALGRFAQADSIVPGGIQGYDRYAYVSNSPVKYTDPSGNAPCDAKHRDDGPQCFKSGWINNNSDTYWQNEKYIDECAAGKNEACPGGTKGIVAWGVAGVVTAGVMEYALLGGATADIVTTASSAAYEKLLSACLLSDVCRQLIGATEGSQPISQETGMARVAQLRETYNNGNNLSYAIEDVTTGAERELVSASGMNPFRSNFTVPEIRRFEVLKVGAYYRYWDSEVKILEYIASQASPDSSGTIRLFSQLPLCDSCMYVISQFQEAFPDINIYISSGP